MILIRLEMKMYATPFYINGANCTLVFNLYNENDTLKAY